MNKDKDKDERDDAELEEDLVKIRGLHPEWSDETAGDNAEGAGPVSP